MPDDEAPDDTGDSSTEPEETPKERAERLVDNSSLGDPDVQETIDAARDYWGAEKFDAMVEEVKRRAREPYEDVDAGEYMDALEDDALIDSLRDPNLVPDPFDQEHAVTETLLGWKDSVESEAIKTPVADSAARGQVTTGGNSMSASEDAAALREIALSTGAQGAIMAAQGMLGESRADALQHLGSGHSGEAAVEGAASQAEQALDAALHAIEAFYNAVGDAADKLG